MIVGKKLGARNYYRVMEQNWSAWWILNQRAYGHDGLRGTSVCHAFESHTTPCHRHSHKACSTLLVSRCGLPSAWIYVVMLAIRQWMKGILKKRHSWSIYTLSVVRCGLPSSWMCCHALCPAVNERPQQEMSFMIHLRSMTHERMEIYSLCHVPI